MPKGWIVLSTEPANHNPSPRTKTGVPIDPVALRDYVNKVLAKTSTNATVEGIYFEVGAELAHVVVNELDDYYEAKAVTSILGAIRYTKLLDPAQAKQAVQLEPKLRPPPPKPPPKRPPGRRQPKN